MQVSCQPRKGYSIDAVNVHGFAWNLGWMERKHWSVIHSSEVTAVPKGTRPASFWQSLSHTR